VPVVWEKKINIIIPTSWVHSFQSLFNMTSDFVMLIQHQKTFYILWVNDNRTTLDKDDDINVNITLPHDSEKQTFAKPTNVNIDCLNINYVTIEETIDNVLAIVLYFLSSFLMYV